MGEEKKTQQPRGKQHIISERRSAISLRQWLRGGGEKFDQREEDPSLRGGPRGLDRPKPFFCEKIRQTNEGHMKKCQGQRRGEETPPKVVLGVVPRTGRVETREGKRRGGVHCPESRLEVTEIRKWRRRECVSTKPVFLRGNCEEKNLLAKQKEGN